MKDVFKSIFFLIGLAGSIWSACLLTVAWPSSDDTFSFTVMYDEPSQDEGGKPLSQLWKTTLYWEYDGLEFKKEFPASTIHGGMPRKHRITIPSIDNRNGPIKIWVTSTLKSGEESQPSYVSYNGDYEKRRSFIDRLATNIINILKEGHK